MNNVCEKGNKGCGPKRCIQCEQLAKKHKRAKVLGVVVETAFSFCCLAVTLGVLCLIAKLLNADMGMIVAGGALGTSWYHIFIDRNPHSNLKK